MGWIWAVARCPRWIRQCHPHVDPVDDVHVDRPHRRYLVRLRLGNPTARNAFPVDLPLSAARSAAFSEITPADSCHLAFSLARLPHHDRGRPDQTARRSMLAGSHLHVFPLRNAADPESDQPLSSFCAALVAEIRDGLESFR